MKKSTLILIVLFLFKTTPLMAETIDLAVEDEWMPYANPDGTGITEDVIKAAFKSVDIDVNFHPRPYARMVMEIKNGKWLGGFNTVKEPKTEGFFIWPKEATLTVNAYYYYDVDRPLVVKTASELKNHERVGGVRDYEYGTDFHFNNGIEKIWLDKHEQGVNMLELGRLDAMIFYEKTADTVLHKMGKTDRIKQAFICYSGPVYVVFSLKNPQSQHYADKLDEGLKNIKANGTYAKIINAL